MGLLTVICWQWRDVGVQPALEGPVSPASGVQLQTRGAHRGITGLPLLCEGQLR